MLQTELKIVNQKLGNVLQLDKRKFHCLYGPDDDVEIYTERTLNNTDKFL